MENELDKYPKRFLPNYFKKIGIGIIVLAFISIILFEFMDVAIFQIQKEILEMIFILGSFFVVWSKDKIEDELKIIIRLKSFAAAVMLAAFIVVFTPIINLIYHNPIGDYTGRILIIFMLFVHQVFYYSMKRKI